MTWIWWTVGLVLLAAVVVALCWRRLRAFGSQVQLERAQEMFKLQREALQTHFLSAAAATGKPRGLVWVECQWGDQVEFVRERDSGRVAALIGVTIRFEAVEGGDMEGLPAVGNLRNASAVFFFDRGQWHTTGKTVFNMNPDEAVEHFRNQYERVGRKPPV
jgi:hypothetical protein